MINAITGRNSKIFFILLLGLFLYSEDLPSQCPASLGCNDKVQISLGQNCTAIIDPLIIIEDDPMNTCDYCVRIKDLDDKVVATTVNCASLNELHPIIDGSYVGMDWKAEVYFTNDQGTEISCWGYITVEDKFAPTISCLDDITVSCSEDVELVLNTTSEVTYCTSGADVDTDPDTQTLCFSATGTHNAGDIVGNISIPSLSGLGNLPFTGSGSGLFFTTTSGAIINIPTPNPMPGLYDFSGLAGLSVDELSGLKITFPSTPLETAPSAGELPLCMEVTASPLGVIDNCGAEVIVVSEIFDENDCGPDGITGQRIVHYTARDQGGLTSDTCTIKISYEAVDLSDIDFPDNYEANCDTLSVALTPEITGRPSVNGEELGITDNFCKLNITYEDDTIALCPAIKIKRKWVVLDWCAATLRENYQFIDINQSRPVVTCPADSTLIIKTVDGCTADYTFRPFDTLAVEYLTMVSGCSMYDLKVEYKAKEDLDPTDESVGFNLATDLGNGTYRATNIPVGLNWVKYSLVNQCGEEFLGCIFEILVQDGTPPTPVCDEYTAVSLDHEGWGRVYWRSLDDGSYDDCGGVSFQVKRDSSICDTLKLDRDDTIFGEYVQFCCQEAGDTIPVVLKVIDESDNYNTCTVSVVVQDKHRGLDFTCPTVRTQDCSFLPDTSQTLGRPQLIGTDECAAFDTLYAEVNSPRCYIGDYVRTWFIEVNGVKQSIDCVQEINIVSDDPILDREVDVESPIDAQCDNYLTDLDKIPTISRVPVDEVDDRCADLGWTFKDNIFNDVEGYCVKIIRTWTVIDWCVYDADTNPDEGIWVRTQIIYVENNEGPEFTTCPTDTLVVNTSDLFCSADVNIPYPAAYDHCFGEDVPDHRFTWSIQSNGVDTAGVGPAGQLELNVGLNKIVYSARDKCSATNNCDVYVDVVDSNRPRVYCHGLISTVITTTDPATGLPCVEIWASDFDLGTDDCDQDLDIYFADSTAVRKFDCNDLGFQTVQVFFEDNNGNRDFCLSTINIQVNTDICDTIGARLPVRIEGDVYTEENDMIGEIEVALEDMNSSAFNFSMTDNAGHFAFTDMTTAGDYRLDPQSNDDYLNGISTLDLVLIQRHILGIELLDSPYKIIAADINNSETINGIDLVELRKLILGIYEELPQNDSWRFVDQGQQFADTYNPWPLEEEIALYSVSTDMMDNDFIGVKVGDVNGTVELAAGGTPLVGRSQNVSHLAHDILNLGSDTEYLVPIYLKEAVSMTGLQLQLGFTQDVTMIDFEAGKLNIQAEDILVEDQSLYISYAAAQAYELDADDVLFYLTLKSDKVLDNMAFGISESQLKAELYTADLNTQEIVMAGTDKATETVLYQNIPNPFSALTMIEFEVPEKIEVRLSILDINGKLIKAYKDTYEPGRHAIEVSDTDLTDNGIYYYKLETDKFSSTRKMIRVD